jgi:hypothetical protein
VLKQADGFDAQLTETVSPMVYVPDNGEETETVGIGSEISADEGLHSPFTSLQIALTWNL